MTDLTARQREVFDFLVAYQKRNGIPPTLREMCKNLGFSSLNAGLAHLEALERKGYLNRTKMISRGIRLTPKPIEGSMRQRAEHAFDEMFGKAYVQFRWTDSDGQEVENCVHSSALRTSVVNLMVEFAEKEGVPDDQDHVPETR